MNSERAIIDRFKDYFRALHRADLSSLRELYSANLVFRDPVHEVRGIVELEDYYAGMCADLSECRFEYLDESIAERSAYIKWIMHYKHPKLGNRLISVRGVSHIRWGDKIEFQEDFYDMGAMLYEQLPLLGNVTRWLRLRLAS